MVEERTIKSRERVVELIFRMLSGEEIDLKETEDRYSIGPKAVYNDFSVIKEKISKFTPNYYLDGNRKYILKNKGQLDFGDAIAILQIIIGSKTFNRVELEKIINKLVQLVPTDKSSVLKRMISITTSKENYIPNETDNILPRIEKFSDYINEKREIKFSYNGSYEGANHTKSRLGVPISMYFSRHHFYLLMYLPQKDVTATYRIDRFNEDIEVVGKAVNVPYIRRPDEGRMINNTFLLNGGGVIDYKFRYRANKEVALNNVPNSHISSDDDANNSDVTIVEGRLYSQGAVLWVLSQGTQVEVLRPQSLIDAVKQKLHDTLSMYEE